MGKLGGLRVENSLAHAACHLEKSAPVAVLQIKLFRSSCVAIFAIDAKILCASICVCECACAPFRFPFSVFRILCPVLCLCVRESLC